MTDILIAANDRRIQYTAVGGETSFDYDFPIFDATHIAVDQTDTDGNITTLTQGTDYTVDTADIGAAAGGGITLLTAATADYVYTLYGVTPYERETDFETAGDFEAGTLNQELDLIVQMQQQTNRIITRAVRLTDADTGSTDDMELPAKVDRAGKFLAFDADGKATASAGTGADSGLRTDLVASTGSSLVGFIQSGTGAVAGTVNDKLLDEPFDAADYGIYPDGTDYSTEMQALVDYISTTKGSGIIRLRACDSSSPYVMQWEHKSGVFVECVTVQWPFPSNAQFEGGATIQVPAAGGNIISHPSGTNLYCGGVRGIRFKGRGSGTAAAGIVLGTGTDSCKGFVGEFLHFENFADQAIVMGDQCASYLFRVVMAENVLLNLTRTSAIYCYDFGGSDGTFIYDIEGGSFDSADSTNRFLRAVRLGRAYELKSITVTAGGTGYTSAPTVNIGAPNDTVSGVQATATASVSAGVVTAITVDNPGEGYTSAPSISFSGGGGSGATATSALVTASNNFRGDNILAEGSDIGVISQGTSHHFGKIRTEFCYGEGFIGQCKQSQFGTIASSNNSRYGAGSFDGVYFTMLATNNTVDQVYDESSTPTYPGTNYAVNDQNHSPQYPNIIGPIIGWGQASGLYNDFYGNANVQLVDNNPVQLTVNATTWNLIPNRTLQKKFKTANTSNTTVTGTTGQIRGGHYWFYCQDNKTTLQYGNTAGKFNLPGGGNLKLKNGYVYEFICDINNSLVLVGSRPAYCYGDLGDAAPTIQIGTYGNSAYLATNTTTARSPTLSTTGAINGDSFKFWIDSSVSLTGTYTFNGKVLIAGEYVEFTFDGTNWKQSGYGSL